MEIVDSAIDRCLGRFGKTELEDAIREAHTGEWLKRLWMLYEAAENEITTLFNDHERSLIPFKEMGRDGRNLRALADGIFMDECSKLIKYRLKIERLIEAAWHSHALRSGDVKYRASLVEFLLEEIRLHKEQTRIHGPSANDRLWSLLGEFTE